MIKICKQAGVTVLYCIITTAAFAHTVKFNYQDIQFSGIKLCDDIGNCTKSVSGSGSVSLSVPDWVNMACVDQHSIDGTSVIFNVSNPHNDVVIAAKQAGQTLYWLPAYFVNISGGKHVSGICPIIG